jgi:hypothetical protein
MHKQLWLVWGTLILDCKVKIRHFRKLKRFNSIVTFLINFGNQNYGILVENIIKFGSKFLLKIPIQALGTKLL